MQKKKTKKPIMTDDLKLSVPLTDIFTSEELGIKKSEWITGEFKTEVEIVKITNKHMMEIEMVDSNGNIIIWYGRNYDTNKIKLNNKLEIVGRAKQHLEVNGVKKTIIKYFTY